MKNKGFTLVETLVAITVLIVGVLGPLNVATRGITDGFYAKNQITATYLAQEALEVSSNEIFNNSGLVGVDTDEWLSGLGSCEPGPCGVVVTALDPVFLSCSSLSGCDLRYDAVENIYEEYDPDDNSQQGPVFRREIFITTNETGGQPVGSEEEAKIQARVSWKEKNVDRTLTLANYVYNEIP